jgi:hypothetical protein
MTTQLSSSTLNTRKQQSAAKPHMLEQLQINMPYKNDAKY